MKTTNYEIAYVYKAKRALGDLIDSFIDLYMARRIGRRSREFNLMRRGKMAIFANDYIGLQINQHGFFERSDLDMVFAFLNPILEDLGNGIALDIGANIGNHSLYFSRYFKAIHSFEPHPRIFDLLQFNARIVDNIVPRNFGLGDANESLELNENWENMGSSSIKHNPGIEGSKVSIEIKRLDDLALDTGTISLMKIDVEGFESNVIRGAWKTIQEHQPLILMEQLASEFKDGTTESIEALCKEGYAFCWHQPWATSKGWVVRRINTVRNIFLGGTYDHNFMTGDVPPATYEMLIAVPARLQARLLRQFQATAR
ncbi:MAG: FkbM family methyltransferase [Limnohabitans sp.]